jgi:hypothetical protein
MNYKNFTTFAILISAMCGALAQSEPAVGLWEKIAVTGPGGKLVARTNYIFTDKKLTEETVFSAIQNAKPLTVICCIKVKNLKTVDLKDVLVKYSMDKEFVDHMKSIKGAPYMYEAMPVDQKEWNPLMAAIMSDDKDPSGHVPYNAPVIAAKLGNADEHLERLELGPTKVSLKIKYTKDDKAFYQFVIKGKQIDLSEDSFPH